MKKHPEYLLLFFTALLGLYIFWPSLKLALFGDDWLAIWYYQSARSRGVGPIEHFLTLYGPQEMSMWFLSRVFGYEGFTYYFLSFLLRMLMALSIYPLTHLLTKNKLASFFATLILATTFVGSEATNWVFNMNVYLAMALINSCVYFFISSKDSASKGKIALSAFFFLLAHLVAPSRVVFLLITVLGLELAAVLIDKDLKRSTLLLLPFLAVFAISKIIGDYSNDYFLGVIKDNLIHGNYNLQFLKRVLVTSGSLVVPSDFLSNRQLGLLGISLYSSVLLLFYKFRGKEKERNLLLLSLLVTTTGIVTPMLIWPTFVYTSPHRHLLLTAPAIALFGGFLLSLAKNFSKIAIVMVLTTLITLNALAINKYLAYQDMTRSENLENIVWKQLLQTIPNPKDSPSPFIFYFEGDSVSQATVSDLIYFGFQAKIGVLFDIHNLYDLPPPTDRFDLLPKILEEGRTLDNKIYQKVPIENVYAYRLENKTNLIDITQSTRLKLVQILDTVKK